MMSAAEKERYEKLIRLKTQRPRAYMHLIKSAKAFSKAKSDPKIRDLFMKAIDLTSRMGDLADGFQTASPQEQQRRRVEMREVAGDMFELKQAEQRERVRVMEARLNSIKQQIETKDRAKDQIVDDMVERILSPRRGGKRGPRPR